MITQSLKFAAAALLKPAAKEVAPRQLPPPPQPRADLRATNSFEPARSRAPVALDFRPQSQAAVLKDLYARPRLQGAAVDLKASLLKTLDAGPQALGAVGKRAALSQDELDVRVSLAISFGASNLAGTLNDPELTREEKSEVLRALLSEKDGIYALLNYQLTDPRNYTYDEMQVVAEGLQEAWKSGVISEADLQAFTESLSEEQAAQVALLLASDPDNTLPGGIVEAFGEQAQAAGHEQAAALALTSSQSLIDAHYPSDSAQKEAFEHVRGFLEEYEDAGHGSPAGEYRAFYALAAANAVRLSVNGNGFPDGEFQSFVEDLGPSVANEVLARLIQVPGDRAPEGAVEVLGQTFTELAENSEGDDQDQWKANAAIAFTSSDLLIERNLDTPEKRQEAFTVLTEQLENLRGEAGDAHGEYSLLEYPAVLNGASRLFAKHGEEIIDRAVQSGDPALAAELSAFLQDTLYSPTATEAVRNRVQSTVGRYAEDKLEGAGNDGVQVGQDVGRLLAIVQLSANAAVDRAGSSGEDGSPYGNVVRDVAAAVAGRLVTALVGTVTANPFIGAGIGAATTSVLKGILGEEPDPERIREQLEDHFRNLLAGEGINTNFGEQFRREINELYAAVSQDLNDAIDSGNYTPAQVEELREQAFELEQLYRSLNDAFEDYENAEDIGRAIEDRDD